MNLLKDTKNKNVEQILDSLHLWLFKHNLKIYLEYH